MSLFLSLLYLFLFPLFIEAAEKCEIKKVPSVTQFVSKMAKPSTGLLPLFGLEGGFYDYLNLGAIFLAICILFMLWFCCGQCCMCCCCTPKTSKKPSIVLVIVFVISAAFLFTSTIMFLISALNITNALTELIVLPANINGGIDAIVDSINETILDTFDLLDNFTGSVKDQLKGVITYLSGDKDDNVDRAKHVEYLLDDFVCRFDHLCSDTEEASPTTGKNDEFMVFRGAYRINESPDNFDLFEAYTKTALDVTAPALTKIARKMIEGADSLGQTIDVADAGINNQIDSALNQIGGQKDAIDDKLGSITGMLGPLDMVMDLITKYVGVAKVYVNLVAYCATAIIFFITIIYTISFFFRCCCTRCLMAWFQCFGCLLNLFIILPAALLAIIFVFADQYCVDFETSAVDLLGGFVSPEDFTKIFVCETVGPVYELGFKSIFDYQIILDELENIPKMISQAFDISSIGGLTDNFQDFTEGADIENGFTADKIIYDYNKNLPHLRGLSTSQAGKDAIDGVMALIEEKDDNLDQAKTEMKLLSGFATEIMPRISGTQNSTVLLSENFLNETEQLFLIGFNEVTCETTRCIYSPIKNTVCVYLYGACAFWIVSAICTIVGSSLMSCAICKRRKGLLSPQVSPVDEDDSDQELAGFSSGTPL